MTQLNMLIDAGLKRKAERQFKSMGMNASTAVSIFFAQVVLHHGLPFPLTSDPFYSSDYQAELIRRAAEMDAGVNSHEHELINPARNVHA